MEDWSVREILHPFYQHVEDVTIQLRRRYQHLEHVCVRLVIQISPSSPDAQRAVNQAGESFHHELGSDYLLSSIPSISVRGYHDVQKA